MRKYLEAGLLSFICCVVLGTSLTLGRPPEASLEKKNFSPTQDAQHITKALTPVVPKFQIAQDLPTLSPEETRPQIPEPISFQTAEFAKNISDDTWEREWDSTWTELSYSISPASKQYRIEIDPSNYGERQVKDTKGNPVQNDILIVLHETTSSAESAIHTFLNHHPKDADQVSYHALILIDGRIVHLVPPEKRAYGAGNSEFRSDRGIETVQANPKYPASVNNFAYHISLETPVEAHDKNVESHSGYSLEQYESLAWLIQQLNVEPNRITTHRAIDRNQDRADPRSFDMEYLAALMY